MRPLSAVIGLIFMLGAQIAPAGMMDQFEEPVTNTFVSVLHLGLDTSEVARGSFTYDAKALEEIRNRCKERGCVDFVGLGPDDFDVEVTLLGQTFTDSNDLDFPESPTLLFSNGVLNALDFLLIQDMQGVDFVDPTITGINFFNIFPFSNTNAIGTILIPSDLGIDSPDFLIEAFLFRDFDATPVPLPAAVWFLGSAILGLASVARRKTI